MTEFIELTRAPEGPVISINPCAISRMWREGGVTIIRFDDGSVEKVMEKIVSVKARITEVEKR